MAHVYWMLVGNRQASSSRIHGYRIHDFLLDRGWRSEILFGPPRWTWDPPLDGKDFVECSVFEPGDVVVCQKLRGPRIQSALDTLRSLGVQTVYLDCDLPIKLPEAQMASEVVCSSEYLAEEYRRNGIVRVTCIPDAYEWEIGRSRDSDTTRLCGVWFGSWTRKRREEVGSLRNLIETTMPNWTLVTVSDHPDADFKWDLNTASTTIADCDFAVIPGSDDPRAFAKSSNRAVQAMALSLPVLAYPIPAYCDVIEHGRNGFLCRTPEDWQNALRTLADPSERQRISESAYRYARRYFSVARIGGQWEDLLERLGCAPAQAARAAPDDARKANLRKLRRRAHYRIVAAHARILAASATP